jgi:hypothetical protein
MQTQAMEKIQQLAIWTGHGGFAGEMDEDTTKFINVATKPAGKWGKRFGEVKGCINLRLQIALACFHSTVLIVRPLALL